MKKLSGSFILVLLLLLLQESILAQSAKTNFDVRIAWDYTSMQQIAEMGGYPRLARLKDSSVFVIYETRTGDIHFKRSWDDGKTWSKASAVFSKFAYSSLDGKTTVVNIANPEVKQLQNGDIIIACNYRPRQEEIAPYSIVIRRSLDNGRTWLPPQTLYVAAPRFGDGCWEPSLMQLPSGELQVYFANENPYRSSNEQEISMVKSLDNGQTWSSQCFTVSFRQGKRDGMPVPVLTDKDIIVAIEDNKIDQFKPYLVRTPISENWKQPVLSDSENRNYALDKTITDSVYMGAPYLLKLPNNQILLSYQTNENRAHDWELSTMEVTIGDQDAKSFGNRTRPFDVPLDKEAKWNSLALWDKHTVVALASTNFKSKHIAPWIIKGYIIPNTVTAGKTTSETPIFIGSKSANQLKTYVRKNKQETILDCRVSENTATIDGLGGIYTFFSFDGKKYKVWSPKNGESEFFIKNNEQWIKTRQIIKIANESNSKGYQFLYTIPSKIKDLKIGFALSANNEEGQHYIEYLANMDENNTKSWIKVVQ